MPGRRGGTGVGSAGIANSSRAAAPSLRLIEASNAVRGVLHRRALFVDPGIFVAAVGGDVEFRAWRADYDSPLMFAQVDAASGGKGASRRVSARPWKGIRG